MAEGSHWLNWCRLCAKDDPKGNVKVQATGQSSRTWDNVLIMAIGKYFEVHMRLEDELSSVLCTECYTLISELIDFAEHVTKVQAIFEVLRRAETDASKHLDLPALRQQYGLGEEDWTHIIKPVPGPETELGGGEENPLEAPLPKLFKMSPREADVAKPDLDFLKQEFVDMGPMYEDNTVVSSTSHRLEMEEVVVPSPVQDDIKTEVEELLPGLANGSEPLPLPAPDSEPAEKSRRVHMTCERCGKRYRNRASYEKHMGGECRRLERREKASRTTSCDLCDKVLSSATALRMHKEGMHQNVKPYICDSCGKQLKTITALNEHKLVHTESRPFKCGVCKAAFKNRARLKAHNQIHEEPSFVCNICGKKLQTRRTWNMHKVVHDEERRLKCDVCGALFKRSKTLKTHLLSHTGLRPYVCNYCGKSFACNANCRSHKAKKHALEMQQDAGAPQSSRMSVPTLEELRVM
ncbi:hypothetical protein KR018_006887 [Drosophila ironensis]|nr:hypothetical protein KR018_006887 [Drosophila ironensis]